MEYFFYISGLCVVCYRDINKYTTFITNTILEPLINRRELGETL